MRTLLLAAAACALLACSDGKSKTTADAGAGHRDAESPDPKDDAEAPSDDAEVDAASALERPPEALQRPPTRLPADLRPPR